MDDRVQARLVTALRAARRPGGKPGGAGEDDGDGAGEAVVSGQDAAGSGVRLVDVHPAPKDGDSSRETLMPERESVQGSVGVEVAGLRYPKPRSVVLREATRGPGDGQSRPLKGLQQEPVDDVDGGGRRQRHLGLGQYSPQPVGTALKP